MDEVFNALLQDRIIQTNGSKKKNTLEFNVTGKIGNKEIISVRKLNIRKFKWYIVLNIERLHSITVYDKKIVIIYVKTEENKESHREQFVRDMEELKKDIKTYGFPYYEYYLNNSYILRSRDYTELHGMASCTIEGYRDIAVIEYIERIASFKYNKNKGKNRGGIHGDEFIQNTGLKWLFDNNQIINAKYSDYAIKASSLFSEKEIIVPESYIYYNANSNANIPPNVRGSSNGIAIGNSIREALLYSLLELYERDTFQRYWYFDEFPVFLLRNEDLILSDEAHRDIYLLNLRGYEISFISIERISSISTVWCILRSKKKENLIFSVSGLSAGFLLDEVVEKAFYEAYDCLKSLESSSNFKEKLERLDIKGDKKINSLEEIHLYYASYMNEEKVNNIINNISTTNSRLIHGSGFTEFETVLEDFKNIYTDIYMHNMTPDFCREYSLYCIKTFSSNAFDTYFNVLSLRQDGLVYLPIA